MQDTHVMIDIETLGLEEDAVIVSIGATVFNMQGIIDELHIKVGLDQKDRSIMASTVAWWMQQSKEAIDSTFKGDRALLPDSIATLGNFINEFSPTLVWSNGSMDINVLTHAYKQYCLGVTPWAYYQVADYRTIRSVLDKDGSLGREVPPTIRHNALEDAKWQTQHLLLMLNKGAIVI